MRSSPNVLLGDIAERYAIDGEIGHGGTAVVYRARDRVRGIDVAIKLMRDDAMGSLSIERFLLEIRNTARLPHPHIVPVLDSGQVEGRPYFVLPFMDGGTLRERLVRQKQLPFEEVISLGVTIAKALEFAHAHGVIHRDVKPENILYNNGEPCLADFGTARALERAVNDPTTSTGVVRGTAAYMSPEQASGERDYDGRTDIYSLACVLYECIAGIQPFVGPTMQAVIAQRLAHEPRPVSVYRPTVPPQLEQVLTKATAMTPADRYPRAGDLAQALSVVAPLVGQPRSAIKVKRTATKWRVALAGTVIAGVAASGLWSLDRAGVALPLLSRELTGDTTLVAIMPMPSRGSTEESAGQELVAEGLREWRGIAAVEPFAVNDGVRRRGRGESPGTALASLSLPNIAKIASDLGAGRFVVAEFRNRGGTRVVHGALYDVRSGRDLYNASVPIPRDTAGWARAYADLVDSLMLRGGRDDRQRERSRETRSLPSFQSFLLGRAALGEWNLDLADSLLRASVAFDPAFARAHLWLAQVRAWKGLPADQWRSSAQLATADTMRLRAQERRQARGLAALGTADFKEACDIYAQITRDAPAEFIGWYGLGDCYRLDRLVLRDPASPSGWRYRRSYHQAIGAYERAFQILPSSYRGMQRRAFDQLRQLLFTSARLRRGNVAGGPSDGFLSRPALVADTLVFIPYPKEVVNEGFPLNDPAAEERAWQRNRRIFRDIVKRWSAAFPESPAAKEGVAISLEMLGDPAAADSFRAARELTTDRASKLRLSVNEALVRVKYAISEDARLIAPASRFADSVLRVSEARSPADAELLARLTTLLGQCDATARLARAAPDEFASLGTVPPGLAEEVRTVHARFMSGCRDLGALPQVSAVMRKAGATVEEARNMEVQMLGSIAAMRFPVDTAWINVMTDSAGDYGFATLRLLLRGDTARARLKLLPITTTRLSRFTGDIAIDAAVTDALLWSNIGDTVMATKVLDKALTELRYAQPLSDQFFLNQLRIGAIGGAMEMRARLATHDPRARARWTTAARALWSSSAPEIQLRLTGLEKNP